MAPEAVRESVDRAAVMLEDMLKDVLQELLVDQAASYLTEEKPELNEMEAVRNAVIQRIELLDANFLAALNGYIQVASMKKSDDGMLSLLLALRDEVLRQVSLRLPPSARVMDAALQLTYKDNRVQLLKTAIDWKGQSKAGGVEQVEPSATSAAQWEPGSDEAKNATIDVQPGKEDDQEAAYMQELLSELPAGVDSDSMVATCSQLIDDMEEQQVIADRQLLARMCLVREEVRWLDQEQNFTGNESSSGSISDEERESQKRRVSAAYFARSNVPQRCIAYLKNLLVLNDPAQRVALLSRAFVEDWDGTSAPSGNKGQEQLDPTKGAKDSSVPEYIRPGRFLTTLHAMEAQFMEAEERGTGPAASQDPVQRAKVMKRLSDVHLEAVAVLDKVQRGELTEAPSSRPKVPL